MQELRVLLEDIDRSYDDFVHGVMSYVKIPGNENKVDMIKNFIRSNPEANSSDVLECIVTQEDFFDSIKSVQKNEDNIKPQKTRKKVVAAML